MVRRSLIRSGVVVRGELDCECCGKKVRDLHEYGPPDVADVAKHIQVCSICRILFDALPESTEVSGYKRRALL